jgi:glyoxylase I family protein
MRFYFSPQNDTLHELSKTHLNLTPMLSLHKIHHIAIICSDYERSKTFYTQVLGLSPVREVYRAERQSYKLDLALEGQYIIELFSFPDPPIRVSGPEAAGLRHLAFSVADLEAAISHLHQHQVSTDPIRVDPHTRKRFTFFADPDGLPLEFYEDIS